jgi:hypothetical protein
LLGERDVGFADPVLGVVSQVRLRVVAQVVAETELHDRAGRPFRASDGTVLRAAEIKPPPVPLLAMSPMLSNVAPRIATVFPSIFTVVE